MNNQFLSYCPKCNNVWNHIIDEGSQKICICSRCNYTKFYDLSSSNESDINSILKELKDSKVPRVITSSYENLISLLESDEVYGALIKMKDTFELVIKLPLVVMLSHISNKIYQKETSNSDFVNDFSSLHTLLQEFIHDAVSYQLTLGNWVTISGAIKSKKVADLFENTDAATILETLYHINQINHKAFTTNEYGDPVAAWRNKTIGHGALNCNKEEVKIDILTKLKLLNTILHNTMDEYAKIDITIAQDIISIKSTDNTSNIVVDPFITLINDKTIANQNKDNKLDNLSIFDSYNDKKHIGHVINHANGKKDQSNALSKKLSFIDDNFKKASNLEIINIEKLGSLTDDTIYTDAIELLDALQNSTFYQGTYFSDWFINCIDNYSGGVFLCCAERGMGKSAFSRVVDQIDNIKTEDNNSLTTYLSEHQNLLIRTFHFNSYYNSSVFSFITRLKDIFTSELIIEENKISYLKSITYITHNIDERYVALFNSLNNNAISTSERKSLFFDFLKSLHSIWKYKYYKEKLVLVLDGIDEIKSGATNINIMDWIPSPEEMIQYKLEDIYIILTSRCKDEVTSNYELYKFLDSNIFNDTLYIRRENSNSKYESQYSKTFIANIQNSLVTKVDGTTKKYSKSDAIKLAKTLEWRFNYLTAFKKIYHCCTEEELKNFTADPFGAYINHLDKLSKSYSNDIQLLLNLLAMTDEALTIHEISYLLTGDNRPTFKLYGMLMDISNFITTERDCRRGTLFSISHLDWKEKIFSNSILTNNKQILLTRLSNLYNKLLKQDLCNIDFGDPLYDGETWLLSNIEHIDSKNFNQLLSIAKVTFGLNQYQVLRNIRSCTAILQHINLYKDKASNNEYLQLYFTAHLTLANCYLFCNKIPEALNSLEIIIAHFSKFDVNFEKNYNLLILIATSYNLKGTINLSFEHTTALQCFDKAIYIFEQLYSEKLILPSHLPLFLNAYLTRANYLEMYDLQKALDDYYRILDIFSDSQIDENSKSADLIASCHSNISFINKKLNKHIDTVLFHCNHSVSIRKKLYQEYKHKGIFYDKNNLAHAYHNRALILSDIDVKASISDYDECIKIKEQLAEEYKNGGRFFDLNDLASSYSNKAVVLSRFDIDESLKYFDKAITICKKLASEYEAGGAFFDLNNLAIYYYNKAHLISKSNETQAITYYRESITIREQLANEADNGGRSFDLNDLASSYQNLATLLYNVDYSEALQYLDKAILINEKLLAIYKTNGKIFNINALKNCYLNKARILSKAKTKDAVVYYEKLIDICKKHKCFSNTKDAYSSLNILAEAYFTLGTIIKTENIAQSLFYYDEEIKLREQLVIEFKDIDPYSNLNNLALSYYNKAYNLYDVKPKEYEDLLDKVISIREQIAIQFKDTDPYSNLNNLALSYYNKAAILHNNNCDNFIMYYDKVIAIREQIAIQFKDTDPYSNLDNLADTYFIKANYLQKTDSETSNYCFDKVITLREKLSSDFSVEDNFHNIDSLADAYLSKVILLYQDKFDLSLIYLDKAISLYEMIAHQNDNSKMYFDENKLTSAYNLRSALHEIKRS